MGGSTSDSFFLPRASLDKLSGHLKAGKNRIISQLSRTGLEGNMPNPPNITILVDPLREPPNFNAVTRARRHLRSIEAIQSWQPDPDRLWFRHPLLEGRPLPAPLSIRAPGHEYLGSRTVQRNDQMPFPIPVRNSSRGFANERRDSFEVFVTYGGPDYPTQNPSRPALGELAVNTQPLTHRQRMVSSQELGPPPRSRHGRRNAMTIDPQDPHGFDGFHHRRHPSVTGDPELPPYRSPSAYARDVGGLPPSYDELFGPAPSTASPVESRPRLPRYSSFDAGRGAAPGPTQCPAMRIEVTYVELSRRGRTTERRVRLEAEENTEG
ncbi:hypothetical protein CB0940_07813 [Cercospora beticola]|uniref:Uncharacterized protein n=1 Tax=Cercospora beticola TaxID=122368 RepID=A0A2G5H7J0_CERBT|nr:hypothetical protein CB0940_07813 [Cercospora beticola]PIA88504.1 hypothetical protein CB0940_07813 [Cercospora beticola]WPB03781.1 hypothetical protein RHO25_008425 [Cercospora beticola]CAK1357452.1 unnamed protein product [Cercospora beticola]